MLQSQTFNIIFGLLLIGLLATGCGAGRVNRRQVDSPEMSWVEIRSASPFSAYTCYLNEEPVCWAYGMENTFIRDYPIKNGNNHLRVEPCFPAEYARPRYLFPVVHLTVCTMTAQRVDPAPSDWEEIDDLFKPWDSNAPLIYENDLQLDNHLATPGFDELGTDKLVYIDQCEDMAVKLAGLLQKEQYQQLLEVFGFTNATAVADARRILQARCPEWVFHFVRNTPSSYTLGGISSKSELAVETGRRLILVHSAPGKHFFWITTSDDIVSKRPLQDKPLHINHIDSFVFGRSCGKWRVMVNGGHWVDLNIEAL